MKLNLIVLILTLFLSCSSSINQDLRGYFLPVQDFSESKIYYFKSDNEQLDDFYWKLEMYKENGNTIFHTVILNSQKISIYEVIEYIKDSGVEMKETRIPSAKPEESDLISNVIQSETFLWKWKQNQKITCEYSTTFQLNEIEMKQVVLREKQFLGSVDSVKLFNHFRSVVKFRDIINQKIINIQTGEIIEETSFKQYSYWAEGIGLYRYEREKGNLVLSRITDYKDWKNQ